MTTKKERGRLLALAQAEVERLGQFLGISQSWGLAVGIGEVGSDTDQNAGGISIDWPRHYKRAMLTFDEKTMPGWSAQELEEYTLHELVHLVFAPLDDALKDAIGTGAVYSQYADIREGVVDQVTGYVLLARDGKRAVKT